MAARPPTPVAQRLAIMPIKPAAIRVRLIGVQFITPVMATAARMGLFLLAIPDVAEEDVLKQVAYMMCANGTLEIMVIMKYGVHVPAEMLISEEGLHQKSVFLMSIYVDPVNVVPMGEEKFKHKKIPSNSTGFFIFPNKLS